MSTEQDSKMLTHVLDMKVLLPTWAGGTRWVGHVYEALDHILNGYKAFWLHLEQLYIIKWKRWK